MFSAILSWENVLFAQYSWIFERRFSILQCHVCVFKLAMIMAWSRTDFAFDYYCMNNNGRPKANEKHDSEESPRLKPNQVFFRIALFWVLEIFFLSRRKICTGDNFDSIFSFARWRDNGWQNVKRERLRMTECVLWARLLMFNMQKSHDARRFLGLFLFTFENLFESFIKSF